MLIRSMTKSDIPAVVAIASKASSWTPKQIENQFRQSTIHLVVEENQQVVGYGFLSIVQDEAEILDIAIDEAYRQQGFGEALLNQMKRIAKEKEVEKIFLEVRHSNQAAIHLYQKSDFQQIAIRKNYYVTQDHKEDALVFVCHNSI